MWLHNWRVRVSKLQKENKSVYLPWMRFSYSKPWISGAQIIVLECPNCGSNVGEESCAGCRRTVPFYVCSRCKQPFFNPRYRSGLECSSCGSQVVVSSQKSLWHLISHYICQNCKAVVPNDRFKHYHSCKNCNPLCRECGGYLATNEHLDYFQCISCKKQFKK